MKTKHYIAIVAIGFLAFIIYTNYQKRKQNKHIPPMQKDTDVIIINEPKVTPNVIGSNVVTKRIAQTNLSR